MPNDYHSQSKKIAIRIVSPYSRPSSSNFYEKVNRWGRRTDNATYKQGSLTDFFPPIFRASPLKG